MRKKKGINQHPPTCGPLQISAVVAPMVNITFLECITSFYGTVRFHFDDVGGHRNNCDRANYGINKLLYGVKIVKP